MRPRRRARWLLACACVLALSSPAATARLKPRPAGEGVSPVGHGSSLASVFPAGQGFSPAGKPTGPAVLVLDLPSGRVASAVRPDLLRARLAPGSVLKVATLLAALESGVVSPSTRLACARRVTVAGRELTCAHPDLGRPLSPAEALAHSCNSFFVKVAERVSRERLSAATTSLGLPAIAPDASLPLAAVGLAGLAATPEELLRALARVADPASGLRLKAETRAVLLEGLRGAARYGTAQAIGERGIDALAKTGTAPMPGGGFYGLVVAVSPSTWPLRGVAVLLPGGSGAEAAAIAANTLAALIEGTYRPDVPSPTTNPDARPANPGSQTTASRSASPTRAPEVGERVIRVGRARAGGYDVVEVPLEDYVARVLAGEAAPRSAPAALEALAIAIRTYALANLGRHKAEGFDLCDLTHCQVMATATSATLQAARATSGRILTYGGRPASVFYTACCGGQSEVASEVWPRAQDQPFLTRHKDPACRQLPQWTSEIRAPDLLRALRASGLRGSSLRNLRIARKSASGRASVLTLEGLTPDAITGDDLRIAVGRTLGWQLVKSTAFDLKRTAAGYRFTGRGSGHGVGLCVVGSARMATGGKSAAKILAAYFPGTTITGAGPESWHPSADAAPGTPPWHPSADAAPGTPPEDPGRPVPAPVAPGASAPGRPPIEILLSLSAQPMLTTIHDLVDRTLTEFSRRLGVARAPHVRLLFHPTVDAYTRATKQPWWTAARTTGDRIDLLPVPVLQERRVFESTVRHELAHVMIADGLADRAAWVKEGAAIHLSGETFEPPRGARRQANAPCPSDDELRHSQSAAALQDAYARAAACYAAQIAAGKKWNEVR